MDVDGIYSQVYSNTPSVRPTSVFCVVNGPYPTREAARAACEQLAQNQLDNTMSGDDSELWGIDRDGEINEADWITLSSGGEAYYELSVFTMIPPDGGPA